MTKRTGDRRPSGGATPHPDDDVPPAVVARAKAAFARRTVAPLAALVSDAAVTGARVLRFAYNEVAFEVRLWVDADVCTVEVVHPGAARAELELAGYDVALVADPTAGRFSFPAVTGGLLRIKLTESPDAAPFYTEWFRT